MTSATSILTSFGHVVEARELKLRLTRAAHEPDSARACPNHSTGGLCYFSVSWIQSPPHHSVALTDPSWQRPSTPRPFIHTNILPSLTFSLYILVLCHPSVLPPSHICLLPCSWSVYCKCSRPWQSFCQQFARPPIGLVNRFATQNIVKCIHILMHSHLPWQENYVILVKTA